VPATPTGPATSTDAPISLWNLGRVRVLQALTETARLSRTDLVARTGLARATVGSVVYDLIGAGLVAEIPDAAPGGRTGRPPQLLSLRPDAAYAVGLDIGHDHVRVMLTDLVGTSCWDGTEPLDVDDAPDGTLNLAVRLVDTAIAETRVRRDRVLGVGLGIACPVDAGRGELHAETIMPRWAGTRPADELAERTGLATRIINDADAGVLAERRFGAAQDCANVVYLRLASGIGAGVVCDGRMLHGRDGLAGELGHVTVNPYGAICRCGSRGCLETVASPTAIAELLGRGRPNPVRVADLAELVHTGDRGAVRMIEDAGEAVGRALAPVVMLLNPELIVIGGDLVAAEDVLLPPLRRTLERDTMRAQHQALRIVASTLGDSAGVRGAAALVLDTVPERLGLDLPAA